MILGKSPSPELLAQFVAEASTSLAKRGLSNRCSTSVGKARQVMLVGLVRGDERTVTASLTHREASSAISNRVSRRASMYVHFLEGLIECVNYALVGWL